MRTHVTALVMLLLTCSVEGVRAQLVPSGSQFQVNSFTTTFQSEPAVAVDAAGDFMVVWRSGGSVGPDTTGSIEGQRFDALGAPVGGEVLVNTYTTGAQLQPAVASDAAGNFVVVWTSLGSVGSDKDYESIQGQRYDTTGAPVGPQFQVNTYTTSHQNEPAVAADPTGRFVVVWTGYGGGADTSAGSIHAQRYDAAGVPQGSEFQVNTYATGTQDTSAVAGDGAGNFVVAWRSIGSAGTDTSGMSIHARRFDATGAAVGAEFQVNAYTTSDQLETEVAVDPAGSFVVVWRSDGSAGSDTDNSSIQAQRYDAAGAQLDAQFQVNTYTTDVQRFPAVAFGTAGTFVVVWSSRGSAWTDDSNYSIQAQRYDAAGAQLDAQFQVNSYTTGIQYTSKVAADGAGNFVVAWSSFGSFGSDPSQSIQAQRLVPGLPILGKKILVKNPTGSEPQRTVIALGKETMTDIGPTILGNPTTTGATLRVITKGATRSDQTYVLDASGWTTLPVGYKYLGPTGADADPVKKVLLKRTSGGTALLKAILKGGIGSQDLTVVPPNLGDEGGIILSIPGGGAYCATFGGAAGGTEVKDTPSLWKVTTPSGQGCPQP